MIEKHIPPFKNPKPNYRIEKQALSRGIPSRLETNPIEALRDALRSFSPDLKKQVLTRDIILKSASIAEDPIGITYNTLLGKIGAVIIPVKDLEPSASLQFRVVNIGTEDTTEGITITKRQDKTKNKYILEMDSERFMQIASRIGFSPMGKLPNSDQKHQERWTQIQKEYPTEGLSR